jgi:hypothetical protein
MNYHFFGKLTRCIGQPIVLSLLLDYLAVYVIILWIPLAKTNPLDLNTLGDVHWVTMDAASPGSIHT